MDNLLSECASAVAVMSNEQEKEEERRFRNYLQEIQPLKYLLMSERSYNPFRATFDSAGLDLFS
jgi:hypothetical protein